MIGRAALGLLAVVAARGCEFHERSYAEAQARAYLARLYPTTPYTVTCMDSAQGDTGLVPCDARVGGAALAIECEPLAACLVNCHDGCRVRSLAPRPNQ